MGLYGACALTRLKEDASMLLSLFARRSGRPADPKPPAPSFFRPRLEGFEDRVVPAAPALGPAQLAPITVAPTFNLGLLNLNVSDVNILNNTLNGVFQIGNVTNNVPITLSASPNPADADCPILNLHLGPIHLDLLGLVVDTSEICLDITAHHGEGLLGDLLCGVSNLLNGGTPLGDILGGGVNNPVTGLPIDPAALTNALGQVLNGVLDQLTTADVAGVSPSAAPGTTNILNLSVGPLDLNLLGLEVALDNCNGGPVTVDITAESGPGKLLGNLLGGLGHLLDTPANGNAIANKLDKIEGAIGALVAQNGG
jgi:hypothetical protein